MKTLATMFSDLFLFVTTYHRHFVGNNSKSKSLHLKKVDPLVFQDRAEDALYQIYSLKKLFRVTQNIYKKYKDLLKPSDLSFKHKS